MVYLDLDNSIDANLIMLANFSKKKVIENLVDARTENSYTGKSSLFI